MNWSVTLAGAFCLLLGVATLPVEAERRDAPEAAHQTQATPADAAPFIGNWTLDLKGPDGPGTFDVSVTVDGEKVTGEVGSQMMPKQPVTGVSKVKESLTLSYTFTWEGMPVDAVVTLTPAKEGPMDAQIDFAGGAYTMVGTATRKPAAK